ncbi:DUF2065 domain-containing protein [Porticoccaceae bacterium]|nr:DUF2065 domain-containing protein [Porticoccaceae bacterium]MDA9565580.1 DUF2065 domain-containing protein [Porticoccaceae bacterium]
MPKLRSVVMLEDIGRAVGLMLVFEGIMPFLSPNRWRNMAQVLASIDERSMRLIGLLSMLLGLMLLIFWR